MVVFKVFLPCKPIFKADINLLILHELISLWCPFYNIWTGSYLLYVLGESEVVAQNSFLKKVFLKIQKNLIWQKILVEVLCCEFCEIFNDIYFARVCEQLPLKNKISTGVSFCKILGFYYKWSRQLLYYEETSLYVPLKILESANYFSDFLSVLASENTPTDKIMFELDNKGMFQGCYLVVFIFSLENIFDVSHAV